MAAMSLTRSQRRQLVQENARHPKTLAPVPRHEWDHLSARPQPDAVYRSRDYLVQLYHGADVTRITINAKDLRPYASTCAERQGYTRRQIQLHMAHRKQGTTDVYLDQHTTPVSSIELRLPGE